MIQASKRASKKLEEIREKNKNELERRKRELYKKIPRLLEIEEERKAVGLDLIKSFINKKNLVDELKEKSESLKEEEKNLLKENNYPLDYLKLKYNCNICKDTGYTGTDICSCKKNLIVKEMYSMSGIEKKLEKENFSTFDLEIFRKNRNNNEPVSPYEIMKYYLSDAKDYVSKFPNLKNQNKIYLGSVGTGKTFLINCIAKAIIDKGYMTIYQTAPKLVNFISDYNFNRFENREELREKFELIKKADLLIIDDLGTEILSSVNETNLFELINDRIVEEKATIISTNYAMEEIQENYRPRIYSRLMGEFDLCQVFGDDLRMRKFSSL